MEREITLFHLTFLEDSIFLGYFLHPFGEQICLKIEENVQISNFSLTK